MTAYLDRVRSLLAGITKLGEWETTRANDVVIYDPNGFGAYRIIAHASDASDAAFIAEAPTAVTRLLAQIDAVEKIAASMYQIAEFNLSVLPSDDMGISLKQHAEDLRAALAGEGEA